MKFNPNPKTPGVNGLAFNLIGRTDWSSRGCDEEEALGVLVRIVFPVRG